MKSILTIFVLIAIGSLAISQDNTDVPKLPSFLAEKYTFEEYVQILADYEPLLNCDGSNNDETDCLKINLRKEFSRVSSNLTLSNTEFDDRMYLIEYAVDREGKLKRVHTYSSGGLTVIEGYHECLENTNPIPRKKLVNTETHRLATWGVIDFFEVRDGRVIVPSLN